MNLAEPEDHRSGRNVKQHFNSNNIFDERAKLPTIIYEDSQLPMIKIQAGKHL